MSRGSESRGRFHMHWFRNVNHEHPGTVVWSLGRCRCGETRAVKVGRAHQPLPAGFRDGRVVR